MQVPPCKCIDFHAERRPRTPNRPATIELALTSRNCIFRTGPAEPRATRLSEAAPPQSRTHFSRVTAPTHHYLTQTRAPASASRLDASRGPRRDAPALGLAPVARSRPRARRRLAPRDTTDHSRRARLVPAAPAAVVSQQPYGAAAERARVAERVARVYQQRQAVPAAVSLRRIASLVPTRPAALSSASACSRACCS